MNVYRQPDRGRTLVHLVNNGKDARPVSEFLPAHDLVLRVKTDGAPVKVYSLREKEPLTTETGSGEVVVRLSKLTLYEVIVVEEVR